ncbi:MAG: SH3 domain-containing protein [Rhizobiaceae bacterium]|nr:SH3 domain-containing protein [Rhizobiaceae bacterium]
MAGIRLPKLRWLIVGAVATGVWAMTQEPPKREHWQRKDAAENARFQKDKADRVTRRETVTPQTALAPGQRPAKQVAVPEAEPIQETLVVTEKVRLRKDASTDSPVISVLRTGQSVEAGATSGKWRRVSFEGKVGWVHGDYLARGSKDALQTAAIPRPKAPIGPKPADAAPEPVEEAVLAPVAVPASLPSGRTAQWSSMRPSRAPQGGDCQCPYDLMLSGQQCGERSAYARGKTVACYF